MGRILVQNLAAVAGEVQRCRGGLELTFITSALDMQFSGRRAGAFEWALAPSPEGDSELHLLTSVMGRAGGALPDVTRCENQGRTDDRESASPWEPPSHRHKQSGLFFPCISF